ncbi:hypothetical protein MNBD_ALPHA11-90 [hydrothermal vent metagenome]|uniref:Uncharacterized protein n=1 Tax=hydrothermal vent metagenome TaxID=652676 RepID=A0A3B0URM5_9ZZZZ
MIKRSIILPVITLSLLYSTVTIAEVYLITPLQDGGIKAIHIQITPEEWAKAQGLQLSEAVGLYGPATAVILEQGKPPRLSYDSLKNIDRRYGGDGDVIPDNQPTSIPDRQPTALIDPSGEREGSEKDEISLDDIPEQVPMELFENDSPNSIALRDGLWRSEMEFQFNDGCPPQIAPLVRNMVGNGASTQATFSNPYHPRDFSDQLENIEWKRASPNGYVSAPFSPVGGAQMPPGMSFSILYAMEAVSAEKVNVWVQVQLTLPEFMAAMVGGSTNCIAEANGNYSYSGG